jgi:acyl carrier protein
MESKAIDVQTFLHNIERQLEKAPTGQLDTQTRFRDLPDWTSLQALVVVASFEWDYGVTISADEFLKADTLQGLYEMVMQKMSQ